MPTVVSDVIDGVRLREEGGVVVSIDRAFIVSGIPGVPGAPEGLPVDPVQQVMVPPGGLRSDEVLKLALDNNGVAQPGFAHPVYDHLFVSSRTTKVLGPQTIMVTCTYTQPGGGSFDPPLGSLYTLTGGSSVEQIETAFEPGGTVQIEVTHGGVTQGGTITPFEGRAVLGFGSAFPSIAPWLLTTNWVNTVNGGPFFYAPGAEKRTWLITDFNFELAERKSPSGIPIYQFSLSMRHNPDTWDPGVVFINPETGKPPENIDATGHKTIQWHSEMDFDTLFSGGL